MRESDQFRFGPTFKNKTYTTPITEGFNNSHRDMARNIKKAYNSSDQGSIAYMHNFILKESKLTEVAVSNILDMYLYGVKTQFQYTIFAKSGNDLYKIVVNGSYGGDGSAHAINFLNIISYNFSKEHDTNTMFKVLKTIQSSHTTVQGISVTKKNIIIQITRNKSLCDKLQSSYNNIKCKMNCMIIITNK